MSARSENRTRGTKATRKRTAQLMRFEAPIAFKRDAENRHSIATNPNRAKHGAAQFDRDSATAKRDGIATKGARKARTAPLGNRGQRFGNYRTPSLPMTTNRADVAK